MQFGDVNPQTAFFRDGSGPHLRQIAFADSFVGTGQQRDQNIEAARPQLHGAAASCDEPFAHNNAEGIKRNDIFGQRRRRYADTIIMQTLSL
jgi:hypothetical protein